MIDPDKQVEQIWKARCSGNCRGAGGAARDARRHRPRAGRRRGLRWIWRHRIWLGYDSDGRPCSQRQLVIPLRVPSPTAANQHWSMDFVHDQLLDGRAFRILTVIEGERQLLR